MKMFTEFFRAKETSAQETGEAPAISSPLMNSGSAVPAAGKKEIKAEIERIRRDSAAEIAQIRQEAAAIATAQLATEIERAKNYIDEAEERANSQLAQASEIERVGTAQFRTWVRNYPVPPDGELLAQMVRDGTLVGWFTRYAQWLREVGENPRVPTVPRR